MRTKVKQKLSYEENNIKDTNLSKIVINFGKTVSVHRMDFPKFDLASFLSAVGGSMGIWLGIGVIQCIDILNQLHVCKIS